MEALKKIVTVRDNTVNVVLPAEYNNRQVELIILAESEKPARVEGKKVDYYTKYYGTLKSGLSIKEIDTRLKELRDEWNRDLA